MATGWMVYLAKTDRQYNIALVFGFALVALFFTSCTFHTLSFSGKYR